MKRRILPILIAGALMAVGAAPALGDAGPPGSTFPEEPGANVGTGCGAVLANTGTGEANMSAEANAITTSIIGDACFGG